MRVVKYHNMFMLDSLLGLRHDRPGETRRGMGDRSEDGQKPGNPRVGRQIARKAGSSEVGAESMGGKGTRQAASAIAAGGADRAPARPRQNLFDVAYETIEGLLVNCTLAPGSHLTMHDLTLATGLGRTPVHQAVNRLAADTLILIRPRHGLQVAPIDLARERTLLRLRRDLERFVVRLATERSNASHRNQLLHLERVLTERRDTLDLAQFNVLDRAIDSLILSAAGEPFLEHTLRPLHTIFRRIGFIHHSHLAGAGDLGDTVDRHLAILNAIATREVDRAVRASDALVDFVDDMFIAMEQGIDPALLDATTPRLVADI